MRIGVFGGSFNPIHNAHLSVIEFLIEKFSFDKLIIIPNANPPLKDSCAVDFDDRVNMIRLALGDNLKVEISLIEKDPSEKHFTYITLSKLKQMYKDSKLYFCMGMDQFINLDKWYKGFELKDFTNLIIVGRTSYNLNSSEKILGTINKDIVHIQTDNNFSQKILNSKEFGEYFIFNQEEFNLISSSDLRAELKEFYLSNSNDISIDCFIKNQSKYPLCNKYLNKEVLAYIIDKHLYENI